MKRKAIIRYGTGYKHNQFKFVLKGDNGEVVGKSSEFYKRKESAIKTLNKYFPGFQIVDKTVDKIKKKK